MALLQAQRLRPGDEEGLGDVPTKASTAGMQHHPDAALFVHLHLGEVIAAAQRTQLLFLVERAGWNVDAIVLNRQERALRHRACATERLRSKPHHVLELPPFQTAERRVPTLSHANANAPSDFLNPLPSQPHIRD